MMRAGQASSTRSRAQRIAALGLLLATSASVTTAAFAAGARRAPQQPPTGLIFSDPAELRKVPLASVPYAGTDLPASVDLSPSLPPPGNQGNQNSCVGWAIAYALKSYQEMVEGRVAYVSNGQLRADRVFSPAFLYNQLNNGRDGGANMMDAMRLLETQGAATWSDMPYVDSDYLSQPSAAARDRARRYRIDYWNQVNVQSATAIKAHLNAGFPVVIGSIVDEGFWQQQRGQVWRQRVGRELGGHAMLLVGYDDAYQAYKVINSWGQHWGDGGYGWIDYEHLRRVTFEAYVAKDAITPGGTATDTPVVIPPTSEVRDLQLSFAVTAVNNAQWPDRPDLGMFLRFDGTLTIPAGSGRSNQSVIHFYYDDGNGGKGAPVRGSLQGYADVDGNAACGTAVYPIGDGGTASTWGAWIPYGALDVPAGAWVNTAAGPQYQPRTTWLVAEPLLFIDNYGVRSGGLFRFSVQR